MSYSAAINIANANAKLSNTTNVVCLFPKADIKAMLKNPVQDLAVFLCKHKEDLPFEHKNYSMITLATTETALATDMMRTTDCPKPPCGGSLEINPNSVGEVSPLKARAATNLFVIDPEGAKLRFKNMKANDNAVCFFDRDHILKILKPPVVNNLALYLCKKDATKPFGPGNFSMLALGAVPGSVLNNVIYFSEHTVPNKTHAAVKSTIEITK